MYIDFAGREVEDPEGDNIRRDRKEAFMSDVAIDIGNAILELRKHFKEITTEMVQAYLLNDSFYQDKPLVPADWINPYLSGEVPLFT